MKFPVIAALLAATALTACAGLEGNPDAQRYADQPGGMMAVKPRTDGTVRYDPTARPAPFDDMRGDRLALNPPPAPLRLPSYR